MTAERTTEIYSIGFTKKGAREFFELLENAGIERLLDVRINNRSQLAGFAKRDDLIYFLDRLLGIEYEHKTELAPTKELLSEWRDDAIDWVEYEQRFEALMAEREIEEELGRSTFDKRTVLLCSEPRGSSDSILGTLGEQGHLLLNTVESAQERSVISVRNARNRSGATDRK